MRTAPLAPNCQLIHPLVMSVANLRVEFDEVGKGCLPAKGSRTFAPCGSDGVPPFGPRLTLAASEHLPAFVKVMPPSDVGIAAIAFLKTLADLFFLPFGFNAAVSLFGWEGWLLAL